MPLTHLDDGTCHRWFSGQAIQDPIVGDIPIPTDFAFFGGKALPGKRLRQGGKLLSSPPIKGALVRGAMDPCIDALTPDVRLAIEVINVCEGDSCPIAVLGKTNRALDSSLPFWRIYLADPSRHPNGGHKVGKQRVPAWLFVFHLQKHAFHAVSQRGFGQSTKVLKGLHQTADHGRGITALDEGHKAHTRVREDRGEAVDLVRNSVLLVLELAPIELDLFC